MKRIKQIDRQIDRYEQNKIDRQIDRQIDMKRIRQINRYEENKIDRQIDRQFLMKITWNLCSLEKLNLCDTLALSKMEYFSPSRFFFVFFCSLQFDVTVLFSSSKRLVTRMFSSLQSEYFFIFFLSENIDIVLVIFIDVNRLALIVNINNAHGFCFYGVAVNIL